MTRTKTGWFAAGLAGAALACVLMFAVDGVAQRRGRGGTPYVRATAGNITINMPVQAAGEEPNQPQSLLGASWACAAQRSGATDIAIRCVNGDAAINFTRRACEPFAIELASARQTSAAYTLNTGCE